MNINTITVAMTGASGVPYTWRLLELLVKANKQIRFLISAAAQVVVSMETEIELPGNSAKLTEFLTQHFHAQVGQITAYGVNEWSSPVASGSNCSDAMVICPCSSGCVAAVANGMSNNVLERAADVSIKEQRKLILVHRETPLSAIHLENLLKLARLGVLILPANPGFYNQPTAINDLVDFIVARILDHLDISNELTQRWGN